MSQGNVVSPRRWATMLIAFLFLGLLPASVPGVDLSAPRSALARVDAAYRPALGFEQIDVTAGWRFRRDATDQGVADGWAATELDDGDWDDVTAGVCWEDLGHPEYDGVGWYRRAVAVPSSWRDRSAYLRLGGVDDEFDLFVNGQRVALTPRPSPQGTGVGSEGVAGREPGAIPVGAYLRFGRRNVIAVRVTDWGGTGGLCGAPVVLTTREDVLLSAAGYVGKLAEHNPEAVWPGWARGQVRGWTVAGLERAPTAAVIGLDGSVSPNPTSFSATHWVYDAEERRLIAPERLAVEQRLLDGYLPSPISTWHDRGIEGESAVLVTVAPSLLTPPFSPVALWRVRLTNRSTVVRRLAAIVALRPYGPDGTTRWIRDVAGSDNTVWVNGRLALVAARSPARVGATSLAATDVSALLSRGQFPRASQFSDPQGLATIALEYPLVLAPGESSDLVFMLPMTEGAPADDSARARRLRTLAFDDEVTRRRADWQSLLRRVEIDVPDPRYADAFYASLGYLLVNTRGAFVTSGPFAHHAMWYRDAAYIVMALLRAGLPEIAPEVLDVLAHGQLASGQFPAALEVNGQPRFYERNEWDAQGQFVFAVAESYRLTGDRAHLEALYPHVARAAAFIAALSLSTRTPERLGTPLYGLLPPGDSAEDLGPREWHHYWDDFWAIGGLREAAYLARVLGREDDARAFDAERASLHDLVTRSIARVRDAAGIDYIPNGPEDTESSSMARGTTPAVWPLQIFTHDDPLIVRSFEHYDEKWVKSRGNAYLHNSGNLWVYGGLEIAHALLFLRQAGRAAEIAQWAMDNQAAPGTFAWAEAVNPETRRFAGGDMPHSWAAAEYVLYLRDALVREEGERLVLADGVPAPWMHDGQRVGIHGAPTSFGPAGYTLVSHASRGYWELTIDEGTVAPAGYLLRGPFPRAPRRLVVDGREITPTGTAALLLPADARRVRVDF